MACSRLLLSVMILASGVAAFSQAPTYHLGRTPSEEEIRAWDTVIGPREKNYQLGAGLRRKVRRYMRRDVRDATGQPRQRGALRLVYDRPRL